ncbi:hypothetical protein CL620_01070, partial [archaeon]|nr:hypothetical protein [archaeon]
MKREYIMVVAVLLLVVVVGIFVYVDTEEALVGEATADPPPPEPAPATSDRVRHINDILYARSRPLASSDYARASRIKIDAPDTKKKYTLYRNTYSDGRTAWADAKKAAGNRPIISFQVGGNLRNPSVSYQIQDQNSVTREVKAVNTIPLPSSDAEQTSGFKDGQAYFQETIGDDDYRVYCSEDGACHRYFYDTARNGYYPLVAEDAKKSIPGLDALERKAQTHARNYRSVKVRDEIVVVQCEGERCRGYKQLESGKLERLNEDDVKKYQANIAPLERELQAFAASAAAQKAAEVESNAYFSKLDEFVNVPDLRDSRKFGDLSDDEKEHVRLLRAAKAADDRTEDEEDKTNVERAKAFISGKFAGVKRDEGVKAADKAVSAQRAAVDATQKTITDLEARQTKGEKLSNPEKKQLADAKKQLKRQAKELDELAA